MTTQLSQHFTLEEFLLSQTAARMGLSNQPDPASHANLKRTAETMEKIRVILGGKPIIITSGYRSPPVNQACGGSSTSAHMYGLAADWTCPQFGSPLAICQTLQPHMLELGIDQLIHEYGDWVHLGLCAMASTPRCQCLTINTSGTTTGFA